MTDFEKEELHWSGWAMSSKKMRQDEEDSAHLLANASNDFVSLELDTPKAGQQPVCHPTPMLCQVTLPAPLSAPPLLLPIQ